MEKRKLEQPQRIKRQKVETKDGLTRCTGCQEYKPIEEFYKESKAPNGRQSKCKQCTKRMKAERAILAQPTKKVQKVKTRDGKTRCTACHEYKSIEQFHQSVKRQNGHDSQCSQCFNQKKRAAGKLPYGFAQNMVCNARGRSKKKEKPFDITTEYVLELWETNNCWCTVSHHPIEMRPHTAWSASIERIDDNGGYTKDNVTIVAQRFNVPAKWTREKFLQVPIKAKEVVDLDALETNINQARKTEQKEKKTRQFRGPDAAGQWLCRGVCGSWKNKEEFPNPKKRNTPEIYCKICDSENVRKRRDILRGFLMYLLVQCNSRTKQRNKLGRAMEFALTLDYLLDLILKQRGRCYISGIPLVFKPNSEWKCSIERIDNSKGYVPGNVCLICAEFQSTDQSQRKSVRQEEVKGTAQWTREMVLECWPELAMITH